MINPTDDTGQPAGKPDAKQAAGITPVRSAYITLLLTIVAMLAMMDRNIVSILLIPIQEDLGASDAAMGALSGTAFALVYAVAALPLARLADRSNRRNLIAAAVAFWSLATALSGAAATYTQMLIARIGVAAGEAAAGPATMSMIGDLYSPQRRGTAVAFISMGGALGISLGAILAGYIADLYSWKAAFVIVGLPGLVVALLVWRTMPEPVRGAKDGGLIPDEDNHSTWRSLKYLASVPTVRTLLLAKILLNLAWTGWLLWVPAFFMRVHGMTTTEMSAWFGGVVGISAVASMLIGGIVSDWLAKRGQRWRLYYICIALIAGAPLVTLSCLVADAQTAWILIFFYSLITGGVTGVSIAAGLSIVRPTMRAFMTAVMAFCISAIGGGLGPFLIGLLNDHLARTIGDESLRYTLLTSPALLVLAAAAFYWASRTMDQDTDAVTLRRDSSAASAQV
jgi:predicted MFS family arabinose efflux permease